MSSWWRTDECLPILLSLLSLSFIAYCMEYLKLICGFRIVAKVLVYSSEHKNVQSQVNCLFCCFIYFFFKERW